MNTTVSKFRSIQSVNNKYKLPDEVINTYIEEFQNQKVTIPFIGKFSTGKTALINTLLGYSSKLLREDITPETAVPTEISYADGCDEIIIETADGRRTISIEEYKSSEFNFTEVNAISLKLSNRYMESIKDVMLVDMPGFDSGYEVHNKAIDNYLPRSLAYLIVFSAEEMTLKYNLIGILKYP